MTTSAAESLWLDGLEPHDHPGVGQGEQRFDVVVVGGGITGMTAAILLKQAGVRVAVVEAGGIGRGVTGCSTAKLTALQGNVVSTIRERRGAEASEAYAQASAAAVERVAQLAERHRIDCDLERRPAFTYAAGEPQRQAVEEELAAIRAAGLPAEPSDGADLPYDVAAAVRLDDQLQFHPVRYVEGLAREVDGDGSAVFEGSRVVGIATGSPCEVRTAQGTLTADRVVVASHFPFLDRGFYFARLAPSRSYCVAMRVDGPLPAGMSIGLGPDQRSIRSAGDLLIVGGEAHEPGTSDASRARFDRLEEFGRRHWAVERVTHRWSAQDPTPHDHLPVIGPYIPRSSKLFVASGFMKWGLTGGTFAATIVSDLIAGRDNPWAAVFDPHRLSLRSLPALAKHNAKALHLVGDRLQPAEAGSTDEVPKGEARIVRTGLGKTGYYRDEGGGLHGVSVRCTHMGCLVKFNAAERSWDCPCHGSRFDLDGSVLEGPATKPLEQRSDA